MRAMPLVLLLASVCGCTGDPFRRPQTWSLPPDGHSANDANLRAMLVNPDDLATGTNADGGLGALAVRPVDALLSGHRHALPAGNASNIGTSSLQPGGGLSGSGAGGAQ